MEQILFQILKMCDHIQTAVAAAGISHKSLSLYTYPSSFCILILTHIFPYQLIIRVRDVNDEDPVFDDDVIFTSFMESSQKEEHISTIMVRPYKYLCRPRLHSVAGLSVS